MDISAFSLQTKVTKMCPKYILALLQNCPSQYQIQINRTCRRINNVKIRCFYPVCEYEYGRYSDCLSNIYGYFDPLRTRHRGLIVSVSNFGTRGPGSIRGGHLLQIVFLLFRLVMQNYFIQVIWNYINDKNTLLNVSK